MICAVLDIHMYKLKATLKIKVMCDFHIIRMINYLCFFLSLSLRPCQLFFSFFLIFFQLLLIINKTIVLYQVFARDVRACVCVLTNLAIILYPLISPFSLNLFILRLCIFMYVYECDVSVVSICV